MKTSTNRGHRCARQALARLAEAELFRQFQYLTVPLGPFCGLQVDYLMSLLDEEEKTGVDALVRAVAADSGRALTGIAAPVGGEGGL